MEVQLASGSRVEKANTYRDLAALHGRTPKAWEYRMQNISHVLEQAGEEWLPGLRPAANVGTRVEAILARLLTQSTATPSLVSGPTRHLLEREAESAVASGSFSPSDVVDERQRVLAAIVRRRGQPAFRTSLLKAYGGHCAMSGCDVVDALEAAHIHPYLGQASNAVSNGLLLRADIHTLFDLYLVAVDPDSRRIAVAPALRQSTYGDLDGSALTSPISADMVASAESLAWHRSQCSWI
ncbi:HNH endonuclease [Stenotrophomonas sp. ESTM1D_MKCIP4_1]|nr:HNH endonuclease [Stenotrophomonas sp. ESTM1D_MKCIP4_1]